MKGEGERKRGVSHVSRLWEVHVIARDDIIILQPNKLFRNTGSQRRRLWKVRGQREKNGKRLTVSLDFYLRFFHFLEKLRITDYSCSVPHLSTSLVQPRDDTHDCPFRNVRETCDLLERLTKWLRSAQKSIQKRQLTIPFAHS